MSQANVSEAEPQSRQYETADVLATKAEPQEFRVVIIWLKFCGEKAQREPP